MEKKRIGQLFLKNGEEEVELKLRSGEVYIPEPGEVFEGIDTSWDGRGDNFTTDRPVRVVYGGNAAELARVEID